jgi:hypothetical protein
MKILILITAVILFSCSSVDRQYVYVINKSGERVEITVNNVNLDLKNNIGYRLTKENVNDEFKIAYKGKEYTFLLKPYEECHYIQINKDDVNYEAGY